MDLAGPRRTPSRVYYGERGNQQGGGNRYSVFYVDKATERIFISFIGAKSDLEADVAAMRAHMRIESRSSVDYDGKRDLDIKTFVSDRDSDLTSNRAVALMMAARIKHDMAASGAKNQTPLLDNVIRRVQDVTRSLLDQSGLPEEYWEFAESVAVGIVNCFPTKSHPQTCSCGSYERWLLMYCCLYFDSSKSILGWMISFPVMRVAELVAVKAELHGVRTDLEKLMTAVESIEAMVAARPGALATKTSDTGRARCSRPGGRLGWPAVARPLCCASARMWLIAPGCHTSHAQGRL